MWPLGTLESTTESETLDSSRIDPLDEFGIRSVKFSSELSSETEIPNENIVTFNVGGVIFQTLESTLKHPKRPAYRLHDSELLERHWHKERSMYFFDRDPALFHTVLNYIRTGVLHLPHNMCSPQITTELLYWGIPRIDIQPCCWKHYSVGIQTLENLRRLEKDVRPVYANPDGPVVKEVIKAPDTWWEKILFMVWNTVTDPSYSPIAKIYAYITIVIILASCANFCVGTLPEFNRSDTPNPVLALLETIFVAYFTIDLVLHVGTAPNAQSYLFTFEGGIDIASLVPDLLGIAVEAIMGSEAGSKRVSMAFVRSLRALRVFRLFRRVKTLWIILYTLKASIKEFVIMLILFTIIMVMFSGILYYLEQNEVFTSIPRTFWWGIITMTTVGYGDMVPQTTPGRLLGSLAGFVGVITLGLTIPTLAFNFVNFWQNFSYMMDREEYHIRLEKVSDVPKCDSHSRRLTVL